MSSQTALRGARVVYIPPPLYYVVGIVGGSLLNRAAPLPIGGRPTTTAVGIALVIAGLAFIGTGVGAVIVHRTTIVPHRPVAKLVTSGAYRWSRNPMYAGLAIAYLGVALLVGSWWPILFGPVVLLIIARLVIRPEEQYLRQRFGDAYATYQAKTRRWL